MSDLGGTRVPGGTTKTEIEFLRTYVLEQLGRFDDAVTAYLAIPDGRNEYYGTRATLRVRAIAANDKTRQRLENWRTAQLTAVKTAIAAGDLDRARLIAQSVLRLTVDQTARNEVLSQLRDLYSKLPAYQLQDFHLVSLVKEEADTNTHRTLANQLLTLGLYDEGLPEFLTARTPVPVASVPPQTNAPPKTGPTLTDEDYTIAVYALEGHIPNRAVRFAEQYWRTVPTDYVLELAPRQLVELLYPVPYRDSLLKHAPSRNVDPRFVLSIARQESRFQADAKSVAAARGMRTTIFIGLNVLWVFALYFVFRTLC